MTFQTGDSVLLMHLTGQELEKPILVTVSGLANDQYARSYLYNYRIILPEGWINGHRVVNQEVWVMDDWIIPANIVIEEFPDTPWD